MAVTGGSARLLGLALLSGVLIPLAYPPWGLPGLAWVAVVPLLLLVRWAPPGRAAGLGLAAGIVAETLGTHWLPLSGVHPGAWALLMLVAASKYAVFSLLGAHVYRRRPELAGVVLPTLWVLLEYVRLHLGWLSMPWGLIGYTQQAVPGVAAIAGVAGVYGVSFALLAGNVVVAELAYRLALRRRGGSASEWVSGVGVPAALATALVVVANLPTPSAGGEGAPLRVAIVQGGVYEPDRHDVEERDAIFERYVRLTREAAERDPDLVIWPESAVPGAIPSDTGAVGILFRLAHELQTPLLVAAGGRDKSAPETAIAQVANSAFLIDPEPAIRTRYDKVRLLPFNEYLPLRSWIPWPSWISPGKLRDAVAGTAAPSFETAGRRYRVQICWESLFPADAGAFADVDFLVTLTNEAFTDTRAGYEHLLAMNAFRAVETGVPVVRATTTSISAVIAPDGSIVQRLGSDAGGELYGVLVADLPPAASRPTLYARLGGLLAPSLLIAGLGGLVVTRRSHIAPGRLP